MEESDSCAAQVLTSLMSFAARDCGYHDMPPNVQPSYEHDSHMAEMSHLSTTMMSQPEQTCYGSIDNLSSCHGEQRNAVPEVGLETDCALTEPNPLWDNYDRSDAQLPMAHDLQQYAAGSQHQADLNPIVSGYDMHHIPRHSNHRGRGRKKNQQLEPIPGQPGSSQGAAANHMMYPEMNDMQLPVHYNYPPQQQDCYHNPANYNSLPSDRHNIPSFSDRPMSQYSAGNDMNDCTKDQEMMMAAYVEKFSKPLYPPGGGFFAPYGGLPNGIIPGVDPSHRPGSLQEAICMYIDYLIYENELRTRISECTVIVPSPPLEFQREEYYREVMCRPVNFPTARFRDWLKLYNVDIEITDPEGRTVSQTTFSPAVTFGGSGNGGGSAGNSQGNTSQPQNPNTWQCSPAGMPPRRKQQRGRIPSTPQWMPPPHGVDMMNGYGVPAQGCRPYPHSGPQQVEPDRFVTPMPPLYRPQTPHYDPKPGPPVSAGNYVDLGSGSQPMIYSSHQPSDTISTTNLASELHAVLTASSNGQLAGNSDPFIEACSVIRRVSNQMALQNNVGMLREVTNWDSPSSDRVVTVMNSDNGAMSSNRFSSAPGNGNRILSDSYIAEYPNFRADASACLDVISSIAKRAFEAPACEPVGPASASASRSMASMLGVDQACQTENWSSPMMESDVRYSMVAARSERAMGGFQGMNPNVSMVSNSYAQFVSSMGPGDSSFISGIPPAGNDEHIVIIPAISPTVCEPISSGSSSNNGSQQSVDLCLHIAENSSTVVATNMDLQLTCSDSDPTAETTEYIAITPSTSEEMIHVVGLQPSNEARNYEVVVEKFSTARKTGCESVEQPKVESNEDDSSSLQTLVLNSRKRSVSEPLSSRVELPAKISKENGEL